MDGWKFSQLTTSEHGAGSSVWLSVSLNAFCKMFCVRVLNDDLQQKFCGPMLSSVIAQ